MEASRAKDLTLSQADWAIERGAIKNEVTQDESRPTDKLFRKVLENLFEGTPYSNDGLGTLESFDKQINAPQLRALYEAYYHPNNAIYVIVGDVEPAATIDEVKKYFGGIPAARLPKRSAPNLLPLKSQRFTVDSDQPYTLAGLAYRFPGYQDRDYAAGQILEAVLSNQRADLYGLVAQGRALQADFEDLDTHPEAGSAIALAVVPVTQKPDDAIAALRAILDKYRASGVPGELVEAEKRRAIAAAAYQATPSKDWHSSGVKHWRSKAFPHPTKFSIESRASPSMTRIASCASTSIPCTN